EEHAVRAVLTHLQELGHQHVGLAVGDEHTWPVREKLRVFEAVTADWGEQPQPVSFTDFSYAGGYEAARDLVARGATAILCGSDDAFWAELTTPPLTTVRQAVGSIARAAVRTALGGGEESRRPARTEVVVRPQLIVRGSTAAAPDGAASMVW